MRNKGFRYRFLAAVLILIVILTALAVYALIVFRDRMEAVSEQPREKVNYGSYYVLIAEESDDLLWESICQGAKKEGEENCGAYVEFFGQELPGDYTIQDRLRMAIDSGVDGIILNGDNTEETEALVEEADRRGIPVVTALDDSTYNYRKCFVGVNNYNLGQEYAAQVFQLMQEKGNPSVFQVTVLLNADGTDTGKNTFYLGLRGSLTELTENAGLECRAEIQTVPVDSSDAFLTEETLRDLLLDQDTPDVLICLSEADTRRAYEAVVDHNQVGEVAILGYYESEEVLEAVDKEIVYATITLDGDQVGRLCVQALTEYRQSGYVNGYFPVDIRIIGKENAADYLEQIQAGEE